LSVSCAAPLRPPIALTALCTQLIQEHSMHMPWTDRDKHSNHRLCCKGSTWCMRTADAVRINPASPCTEPSTRSHAATQGLGRASVPSHACPGQTQYTRSSGDQILAELRAVQTDRESTLADFKGSVQHSRRDVRRRAWPGRQRPRSCHQLRPRIIWRSMFTVRGVRGYW
jgi:hypothetical protein